MFALKTNLDAAPAKKVKLRDVVRVGAVCMMVGGMAACSADFSGFAGAAGGATGELICAIVELLAQCDT